MVLTFLTYIFFAGGVVAILYAMLALLSLMNHARVQKPLPEGYEPGADTPATSGPAVAGAFWGRAEILLQNGRFDAALADCKRVLEINPDHAEAKRLWNRLFPPEPVSKVTSGKAIPAAAEVENANHIGETK
jgi:hypothetical protein